MNEDIRLAIVEDDPDIRTLLGDFLAQEGFAVRSVDGGEGLDQLLAQKPALDLIVLDWMLPGEDGLSICSRIRKAGGPPIIMLTAKDEDVDRVLGLEMGADDYVSKPFNPRVLLAHIRAVLRRTRGRENGRTTMVDDGEGRMSVADLVVDATARSVTTGEPPREVTLTSAEFDLLLCFVTRPQRVLSRDQLLDWTRGRVADVFDRTIDVQVSRLRRRLDEAGSLLAAQIKTVRNAGYILAAPVHAA